MTAASMELDLRDLCRVVAARVEARFNALPAARALYATQLACEASLGDPAAMREAAAIRQPMAQRIVQLALDLLRTEPAYWVAYYAIESVTHPVPRSHPSKGVILHGFGDGGGGGPIDPGGAMHHPGGGRVVTPHPRGGKAHERVLGRAEMAGRGPIDRGHRGHGRTTVGHQAHGSVIVGARGGGVDPRGGGGGGRAHDPRGGGGGMYGAPRGGVEHDAGPWAEPYCCGRCAAGLECEAPCPDADAPPGWPGHEMERVPPDGGRG
jgi:hypothetical protein